MLEILQRRWVEGAVMMARWNEKSKVDDGKRRAVGAGVASAESGE